MQSTGTSAPTAHPIHALLRRLAVVQVPRGNAAVFLVLAGVALFLLVNEALTGVLMALYFKPSVADANNSVRFVITEVEFGSLVRALHYWGAQLLIVTMVATLAWALIRRAYKSPNGLAWGTGVALTFIVVLETFTGGLLPWTHRSVIESQVSSALAGKLPVIGKLVRGIMLGGDEPGDLGLVRVLGMHAGILPLAATALLLVYALHAAGSASKQVSPNSLSLFPQATLRVAAASTLAAMVLVVLASVAAPGLHGSAELARATAAGIRPSWYLIFVHQLLLASPARFLGVSGATAISTVLGLGALVALLFPVIDRKGSRAGQVLGLVVLALIVGGTIRALLT